MVKRFFFVFCAFYIKTPSLGIPLTTIAATVNLVFVLHFRPFTDVKDNKFEVFNELITVYFLITLSGIIGDFGKEFAAQVS